jgi:ABC-type enterobactin transport system permease subunit
LPGTLKILRISAELQMAQTMQVLSAGSVQGRTTQQVFGCELGDLADFAKLVRVATR